MLFSKKFLQQVVLFFYFVPYSYLPFNISYYNFKYLVMWAAVICLILLVQLFQSAGTKLAIKCDKRLRNRS